MLPHPAGYLRGVPLAGLLLVGLAACGGSGAPSATRPAHTGTPTGRAHVAGAPVASGRGVSPSITGSAPIAVSPTTPAATGAGRDRPGSRNGGGGHGGPATVSSPTARRPPAARTGATTSTALSADPSASAIGLVPAGGSGADLTPSPATCRAADLQVAMDIQPRTGTQPADRTRALIVLTDSSASPCALDGFATVEVGAAARPSAVLPASHLDLPGPAGTFVLPSEGSAFAGLEWTVRPACKEVASLWLTPPGTRSEMAVSVDAPGGSPLPVDLCPAGAGIGPLSPTSEGTVDFPDSLGG
jgi:hypothetical protein